MRIGIDARLWNETGVGRYIRNLVVHLATQDSSNEYVLFVKKKDEAIIAQKIQNKNWKIVATDIHWHSLQEQLFFPFVLRKQDLDLVHFPYFSVPIFYPGKFIVTIHDLILHQFPTGNASTLPFPLYYFKHFLYQIVITIASKRAKKIIAVSKSTKQEIVNHLKVPSEKIEVIYEGIDTAIDRTKQSIHTLPNNYFLYIGNAYPHKNIDSVVNAFALLVTSKKLSPTDLKLVFVGKPDYFYKRLHAKLVTMGIKEYVTVLSGITDSDLGLLYHHAKALIMPSFLEGFSLPVVEALSMRCLVLASDIAVHHEIAGDGVLYFNPHLVSDLVKKMDTIVSGEKKEFTDIINKGFLNIQRYSWETMAKETSVIYAQVSQ